MSPFVRACTRIARELWDDKGRALTALVSALLLWVLLSGQVERTEKELMIVRVVAQSDTTSVADGLIVRIPDVYAVEEFEPKSIELELKGTNEDLSRVIGTNLAGVYIAPDDLLGKEVRREIVLDVARDFEIPRLKAVPSISIEGRPTVQLRVTKRERVDVALNKDNMQFSPPSLGEGVKVEFTPSILPVSGPDSDIARIRDEPRRLKIGPVIDERLLQAFMAEPQTVHETSVTVIGPDGTPHRPPLLGANNGDPVRIQFRRERQFRNVAFKDVRVERLIPEGLMRVGAEEGREVSLSPETVNLALRVPEDYFKTGETEASLRKALTVLVNVGEMQPNVDGQKLPARLTGLPKNAEVTIEPAEIDVVWNIRK